MSNTHDDQQSRSRHACESCRRKKEKCTGERPTCSRCQRSSQDCVYLPRDQRPKIARVRKPSRQVPRDRIQGIEAQIGHLYSLLSSTPRVGLEASPEVVTSSQDEVPRGVSMEARFTPDISREIIQNAIRVYSTKIHLQPLPLFSLRGLSDYLMKSSPFLCWSFLALCHSINAQSESLGNEPDAAQSYSQLGRNAAMKLACEGTATLEVLQALCLLALSDMIGKPARAWMTIGLAARLQTFQNLTSQESGDVAADEEDSSRCYWSIFILERAFSHQVRMFGRQGNLPKYPANTSYLPPLHSQIGNASELESTVADKGSIGHRMLAYCIKLISVWGQINPYIHKLRSGKGERPWLPNSINTQLVVELYECEAQISPKNFLRNVHLSDRSTEEFLQHREYWTLWAFSQIAFHSTFTVLNHPFIHLISRRDIGHVSKPRFFLQKTVDQALFHSGRVVHLLRLFDNFPFEFSNPLIGHMVAATATVLWFFQFVGDNKVSRKAKEDFRKCQDFLTGMSSNWPHIAQKAKVSDVQQEVENMTTTINFRPSVIWALLDSSISQMANLDAVGPIVVRGTENSEAARMTFKAKFVPPLADGEENGDLSDDNNSERQLSSSSNGGFDPMLHGFFTQFDSDDDVQWLSSMSSQEPIDGPLS